ncbi:phosphopantetheine-binding protein [Streptomyces kutzneri]|uniref:phosphopantetheine-binding protein n=1 Tax=Streptomyces kutzneri TaxID=3051179 RepID=UPI0028D838FA|nr:phosphopantetheine-binding protein [Streptomyces sp. DSM 40907]
MESSPKAVHQQGEQGEISEQPHTCPDPSAPLVQEIAELWASFLDEREVGADDNFFEIGGNSLIGIRILERLSQTYGVQLSVRDFYLAQTPARVAELIELGRARA